MAARDRRTSGSSRPDEPGRGHRAGTERRTGSPTEVASGAVERATTGAATRLAEEMRREAELRARAGRSAEAGGSEREPGSNGQTAEDLSRVSVAAREFLERLGEATGELAGLLRRVQDSAATLVDELGPIARDPSNPGTPEPVRDAGTAPASPPSTAPSPGPPVPKAPTPPPSPADGKAERARLLAFNMALNGASREETARYLAENLPLVDRTDLLNEVYSRAAPETTAAAPPEVLKDL